MVLLEIQVAAVSVLLISLQPVAVLLPTCPVHPSPTPKYQHLYTARGAYGLWCSYRGWLLPLGSDSSSSSGGSNDRAAMAVRHRGGCRNHSRTCAEAVVLASFDANKINQCYHAQPVSQIKSHSIIVDRWSLLSPCTYFCILVTTKRIAKKSRLKFFQLVGLRQRNKKQTKTLAKRERIF